MTVDILLFLPEAATGENPYGELGQMEVRLDGPAATEPAGSWVWKSTPVSGRVDVLRFPSFPKQPASGRVHLRSQLAEFELTLLNPHWGNSLVLAGFDPEAARACGTGHAYHHGNRVQLFYWAVGYGHSPPWTPAPV